MRPVFSDEFFAEIKSKYNVFINTLQQNAVIGVLIFIAVLILVLLQQIILIILFPIKDL